MARLEFLFSLFGFATTSAFWLLAAFLVPPTEFGDIAKLQALVMLVVATLSLRTYDISFFLLREHGQSQAASFRRAFSIELMLFLATAVLIVAGLSLLPADWIGVASGIDGWQALLFGLLAAFPVLQGSTQALLRQQNRDFHVALSDLASGVGFALATAAIAITPSRPELIVLSWLVAAAIRPLVLALLALPLSIRPQTGKDESTEPMPGWPVVVRFLALGQVANIVKNNGPNIELIVLGSFLGPAGVAVFRVSRSFLQLSVVLMNIVYQRAFRGLAKLGPRDDRRPLTRQINRNSLLAWLGSLPMIALGGVAFVYLNPHPDYAQLWTALPLMALATLPTALQQAQFADLAISGRYVAINLCYLVGMAVLVGLCLVTGSELSVELFASWLFVANLTRLGVMHVLLRRTSPRA